MCSFFILGFYYVSHTGLGFEEAKFNKTGFCHRWIYSSVNAFQCWRGLTKVSIGHCEATGLSENFAFPWWKGRKWETILKMNFWLKHEGEVHNAEDRRKGILYKWGSWAKSRYTTAWQGYCGGNQRLGLHSQSEVESEGKMHFIEIAVCYVT